MRVRINAITGVTRGFPKSARKSAKAFMASSR